MRFGESLRDQRERLGISLDDVAISTRVSQRHLTALEEDRFAELPGGVFSRGIVRSYAQHCGLDVDGTVQRFVTAMRDRGMDVDGRADDWVELAEAVRRSRPGNASSDRIRWLGVGGMLLAVLLIAAGALWLLDQRGSIHLPHSLPEALQTLHDMRGKQR